MGEDTAAYDIVGDFDDIIEINAFLDFVIMNHAHVLQEYWIMVSYND